jgi:hypothetical protein
MTATYAERDRQTTRTMGGVRLKAGHWASVTVHSHRTWTGPATMTLWCGIEADFEDGAKQTTDLISCSGCGEQSRKTLWGAS